MFYTIFILLIGFILGCVYSRGRANPLEAAWLDTKRIFRATCRVLQGIFKMIQSSFSGTDTKSKSSND